MIRFSKTIAFVAGFALLFPLIASAQKKKDNSGKEFYVAFAENQGSTNDSNFFALYITSKVPTRGTVEVAALNFSQTFAAAPGTITTVELPDGKNTGDPTVEITTDESVVPGMAVHVTSDDDVTIYGINSKKYSTDAFMALPVDVLGTEYRTINYQSSYIGDTPGEFWIVGVNDSTTVTITPKALTRSGNFAGVPFNVMLSKGDVYLVQGVASDPTNDLTGSLIESDEPIAVLSGHVRTEIPYDYRSEDDSTTTSRNHLVEQMPPVSAWGDSALVVPYASSSLPDLVRIVSGNDSNTITVNGKFAATLNAGDFYEITQVPGPLSIQGTSPIVVGQFLHTSRFNVYDTIPAQHSDGDPAYALVFPVEQFDTAYTFISAERDLFVKNFVNIVANSSGISGMVLDGKPVAPSSFQPIPGSNYVYAQIELEQGTHNISGSEPFGITVYALGPADAYSYTGGSLLKTITPLKTVDLVIDFGDRVMMINPGPTYSRSWDTTVYLQNISSDPYTINSFQTRTGNAANFKVVAPTTALTINAGAIDSMTIRFSPDVPYLRMHSTVMAMTEHLKAYVVDVYGRGVLDEARTFSDSNATMPIDTLDFGIFQASDNPRDSFVYVFNKGEKDVWINSATIVPSNMVTNASDFVIKLTTVGGVSVTPPYLLPKYKNTLSSNDTAAKIVITFTPVPNEPNGFKQAELDLKTKNGLQRKVILLARVRSILKSSVTNVHFDSISLCQNQVQSIFIDNPNDFQITVTNLNLGGVNASDFTVITKIPLTIPASSRGEIQLQFTPHAVGASNAIAILFFDQPEGFTETLPLSAYSYQLTSRFWARDNIHILPGEETVFPIYAKIPMQNFKSSTFILTLTYDGSHLQDFDYIQDNTLTAGGSYTVTSDSAGYSQYIFQTSDGSAVRGGGEAKEKPVIYIKFRSHLNGEDPVHYHEGIDIHYSFTFDHSPVPSGCILSDAPAGRITLDSTCERVYLLQDTLLYPSASYIMPVRPNPVYSGQVTFTIDVPHEDVVHLDVMDMRGAKAATIIDDSRKPGTYDITWDASRLQAGSYYVRLTTGGQVKYRQMVVVR